MNIVITLNNFYQLTGSELYVYELSRVLAKRKHSVSIISNNIGGIIADKAIANGVTLYHFFDHPAIEADIIHAQQPLPTHYTLAKFPTTPHVVTIHSTLSFETPVIDPHIKKYICVRPEIAEMYPSLLGQVIYNGVDTNRFFPDPIPGSAYLFVGTIDQLRNNVIIDLQQRALKENKQLWVVSPTIKQESTEGNVTFYPATWDVEKYTQTCGITASVYVGRTTIEGWACGKQGYVYDVDEQGTIKDIAVSEPPKDMTQFDIEYMTDRVLDIYESAI